jgi:hypothetical protein
LSLASGDSFVGFEDDPDHSLLVELELGSLGSGSPHPAAQTGITSQPTDGPDQCLDILRRDEQAGDSVVDHLTTPSDVRRDDG